MSGIAAQLAEVKNRVAESCHNAGREVSGVKLVAVSKTFPAGDIRKAIEAGQTCFGESRFQEAEPKIAMLPEGLEWHFIGSVQRNKVRKILPLFGCIHAIDSLKLATYTSQVAGELGLSPEVFLQVNLAGEESKGGFSAKDLRAAMVRLMALPEIRIKGLMTIPPDSGNGEARKWFCGLRELRDALEADFSTSLPFLSMGMSGDYEAAILEGATHVRVGSSIFGTRSYRVDGELG